MSRGASKRRLRVRRKRGTASVAGDAVDVVGETVARFGCCLVEVVASAAVFIGLHLVPAYMYFG